MKEKESYDINYNFLKSLYSSISQSSNSDNRDDLIRLLSFIQRIKKYNQKTIPRKTCESAIFKTFQDDVDGLEFYRPFYPLVRLFARHGYVYSTDIGYMRKNITNQEAMDAAEDFFKQQGWFYFEAFLEFKEEAPTHLKFIKPNALTEGEATYFASTEEAFVLVPNRNDITKQVILIHELEHVIETYNNENFFNNKVIRECGALFMEMVASDYFADKYKLKDDNIGRRFNLHNRIKIISADLLNRFMILYNIKESNKLFDIFEIFQYDYLEEIARTSLEYDFSYPISYLIAIELYTIYQDDKEKALYFLQTIITWGNDENIMMVLKELGIDLNRNALSYEKKLYKKLGI